MHEITALLRTWLEWVRNLPAEAIVTSVVAFGSALAGALAGSLSAYYLGRNQQKRDQREKRYESYWRRSTR
jgi:hypothetical protein